MAQTAHFRTHGACRVDRVTPPEMPGPFVNANVLSLGCDADGVERFWCSTYNAISGPRGVVFDEQGRSRMYRFGRPHSGFYSAALQDNDTLWLCGDLSCFVRLDLRTGKFQTFKTSADAGTMTFAGMAYDPATRQLFAGGILRRGVQFDTRTHRARLFKDQWPGRNMYYSFANGDGTWTLVFHYPASLIRWNPRAGSISESAIKLSESPLQFHYRLLQHPTLGVYLPTLGWYDSVHDRLHSGGPRPSREMMWLGMVSDRAIGGIMRHGNLHIATWNLQTGSVEDQIMLVDTPAQNVALSARGNLVAVSVYGDWRIHDGCDMSLKLSRSTPARARGGVGCLRLIDKTRLLGTTYITQRFWEFNLENGTGQDQGRAAPGSGQITQTCRIAGRIYMAAYSGGELLEYDPRQPAAFPSNPRVVAQHPLALRPLDLQHHKRRIWYACSRKYGQLGSVLFKYDLRSGEARSAVDALGPRAVTSILLDVDNEELVVGSSIQADQGSATPRVDQCVAARLAMNDLSVRKTQILPAGQIRLLGWIRPGLVLAAMGENPIHACVLHAATLELVDHALPAAIVEAAKTFPPAIVPTNRAGQFVVQSEDRLELHDLASPRRQPRILIHGLGRETYPFDWQLDGRAILLRDSYGRVKVVHDAL